MGIKFVQTTTKDRSRIMKLADEGLSFATIAQRTGFTARTCSRVVAKGRRDRAKIAAAEGSPVTT